jgi:hypothetical protein
VISIKLVKKLKRWFWLQTMTIQKYKEYLRQQGINESEGCYQVDINNCDGRCQGCSDCPLAQGKEVTRKQMMIYEIKCIEDKKYYDQIMEELKNDEEFNNSLKEIFKNFRENRS